MASTVGSRLAFEKAKEAIQSAGFSLGQAVLSQSFLRTEVQLVTTKTSYQFPVLVNDNFSTTFNTMTLLNLQDAFYCSSILIGVSAPSSATSTEEPVCTYPDLEWFTLAQGFALNTFYNGNLSLTVNNRQIVPQYDIRRHLYVPYQQFAGDPYYAGSTINYRSSIDGVDSGFCPVEPGWVFVGSKQNNLQITLPTALSSVTANQRAVIIMHGHLAQNVTPVR